MTYGKEIELTVPEYLNEVLKTQYGDVTVEEWMAWEIMRLKSGGSEARSQRNGPNIGILMVRHSSRVDNYWAGRNRLCN